ncbi:DUF3152 domain-containing protein [Streptomyces sp. NPDC093225]|uniref:DUF3152 domain-containing protein n=1 Tax=Streptomyces sp. NPDC093225 TaxID=3366034 RepID=UPI00380C8C6B
MGRHSRKGPPPAASTEPTAAHPGYAPAGAARPASADAGAVYGDWRGVPRPAQDAYDTGSFAAFQDTGSYAAVHETGGFAAVQQETGGFDAFRDTGGFAQVQDPGGFSHARATGEFQGARGAGHFAPGHEDPYETGAFPSVHETGGFPSVHDTGGFPSPHDTGAFEAVGRTGEFEAFRDTGAFPRVQDTGGFPHARAAGGVQEARPAGHFAPSRQAPYDTGAGPSARDTGGFAAVRDTGAVPRATGTGAFPRVGDTGAFPPVHDAAGSPRGAGAGTRRAPAEDVVPTVPRPRREDEVASRRGGLRVRTYTGIAAAAVTVALAVVVAGQVTGDDGDRVGARAADDGDQRGGAASAASRSDDRTTPAATPAAPAAALTFEQKMAQQYPLDPKLQGSGQFETVPGAAPAPGKGRKVRYRVDIEKGLALDGALFAEAVQRTLNDRRSWAHDGDMTFERVSSGESDFVITLASPGTTGTWCAKSDLDTTEQNVSCDSAKTERVMINAFRWAQGAVTFGADKMFAYRQMLINHEVGHRLGHGHVNCRTSGALAPIMQQQTKSLDLDGIKCRPNPWVYPGS